MADEASDKGHFTYEIGEIECTAFYDGMWQKAQVAFDADPELAEKNRRTMFDRAIADQANISGYHFGFPNVGTIAKDGNGYVFEPLGA